MHQPDPADPAAAAYLTAAFDQIGAALAAGQPGNALAVVGDIRRGTGRDDVADRALDGIIEAQRGHH